MHTHQELHYHVVSIALTHILQEGPLLQRLVSLGASFCVDQCQSDWVGSYFLHQLQLLMSVHFEKKSPQGAHPNVQCTCKTMPNTDQAQH